MKDELKKLAELGLGSRLNRLSGIVMKEIQLVYDRAGIDFDPYLFPIFKIITDSETVTNSYIQESLQYTQPAITQALNKLTDKSLISFKTDVNDKRKKLFYLTKKGREAHKRMVPLWKVMDTQVKELTTFTADSLTAHISHLEGKLQEQALSTRILQNFQH
ncbi:MarR family winged helix-turn-helix transcriptional regulator [Spongiimicrobium sp. 3-5]|uniref:MarR family winged helix-turn-helix transcriptional regulator n=1 Tax=Spongiimicrobium sp. 3-5 TaxID=3332596 RepID=UPI0039817D1B